MIPSSRCRVVIFLALLLWVGLSFYAPSPVVAASPPPLGVAPLSLAQDVAVEMTSLQVDAYLKDVNGRTFASVQCQYRLRNTDSTGSVEFQLGFPLWLDGDPAFDLISYQGLSVTVDGQAVQLDPPVATRPSYVVSLKLAAQQKIRVDLEYSLDLGEAPVVELRYIWEPASTWVGSLGSVRVTVHLPHPTTPDQFLEQEPLPADFDGRSITWDGEGFEPQGEIRLRLIAPGLWHDIHATRQAIAAGEATAEEHYRLASLYWQLDPPDQPASPGQPDFHAEILSHLLQAQNLDPTFVQAYLDKATLYLAQAELDEHGGHHYLSLASQALGGALAQRPGDSAIRDKLVETYQQLAVATRQQGDYRMALTYFNKALEFSSADERPQLEETIKQEIETIYMAWTASLLGSGQIDEALGIVAEQMGEDPIPRFAKYRPLSLSFHGRISTTAKERQGSFVFTPFGDALALEEQLDELAASLSAVQGCDASRGASEGGDPALLVRISYEDSDQLGQVLGRVADVFPPETEDPTLVLIRSALIPRSVWVAQAEIPMVMDGGYREGVDLIAPATALDAARERTNWAIMDLQAQNPEEEREKALRDVSLGLLQKYARLWQRQRDESRIDYEVTFTSSFAEPQVKRWSLGLGKTEDLRWGVRLYDRPVIVEVVAGAIVVVGLVSWLWDLVRRRRR
ncbi:MAG: tetratricopeptide repeat protein [Anaerolineae bacterium]|nr:tetratricopeptide repeat protein [Anaerolineae bacterium]